MRINIDRGRTCYLRREITGVPSIDSTIISLPNGINVAKNRVVVGGKLRTVDQPMEFTVVGSIELSDGSSGLLIKRSGRTFKVSLDEVYLNKSVIVKGVECATSL